MCSLHFKTVKWLLRERGKKNIKIEHVKITQQQLMQSKMHGMYNTLKRGFSGGSVVKIQSVQLLSCVRLFVTPWTAACQASRSITTFQSLLKLVSVGSLMPSNRLILCCPLLLLPSPAVKTLPASMEGARDLGSIPGWGRSPEGRNGNPLQYSCLENLTDRQA